MDGMLCPDCRTVMVGRTRMCGHCNQLFCEPCGTRRSLCLCGKNTPIEQNNAAEQLIKNLSTTLAQRCLYSPKGCQSFVLKDGESHREHEENCSFRIRAFTDGHFEETKCCKCRNILLGEIRICKTGHSFCEGCASVEHKCIRCQEKLLGTRNLNLEMLIKTFNKVGGDDAVTVHDEILCANCKGVMLGATWMCTGGHSLCQNCKVCPNNCAVSERTRNYILEQLIEKMQQNRAMPCVNESAGCKEIILSNRKDHEGDCKYRLLRCPLSINCQLTVRYYELLAHYRTKKHKHKRARTNTELESNGLNLNVEHFGKTVWDIRDNIFYFYEKVNLQSKMATFSIRVQATPKTAKKFKYALQTNKVKQPGRNLFMSGICSSTDEIEFTSENSICIPLETLRKFLSEDVKFKFTIYLAPVEEEFVLNNN